MTIKNILFDLGGVLINIEYEGPRKALESFGGKSSSFYSKASQPQFISDLEIGIIDEDEFLRQFQTELNSKLNLDQLRTIWNAVLLEVPSKRIDFVKTLKAKYRLFILSNTNIIHETAFLPMLAKAGLSDLKDLFEIVFYSHEVGLRKPDKEIFEFVLTKAGIEAEETLYIEDSPQHLDTAESLGFKTIRHQTNEDPVPAIRKALGINQ